VTGRGSVAARFASFARAPRAARIGSVCEETSCPNREECYRASTAAFVLLGNVCTRACAFCFLPRGTPAPPDPGEAQRVASLVEKLRLRHAVLTSVDRDDLPDGGATHFAAAVRAVRARSPGTKIEVLVPDFGGDRAALHRVLEEGPDVLSHALETVGRLFPTVRPGCDYARSLELLRRARDWTGGVRVKSALSLGLGEKKEEVVAAIADLASVGCELLAIGAYAPPSKEHPPSARAVSPDEYAEWKRMAEALGIRRVVAGPQVRTTYRAAELLGAAAPDAARGGT
jgi:lipoic acid synthetase